jgi:hypothetical protein
VTTQPEPRDESLISLFRDRDGRTTRVILRDGRLLTVLNIAWGYDMGDEFAHVTTNVSPSVEGTSIDFFYTSDVETVSDPSSGDVLFTAQ